MHYTIGRTDIFLVGEHVPCDPAACIDVGWAHSPWQQWEPKRVSTDKLRQQWQQKRRASDLDERQSISAQGHTPLLEFTNNVSVSLRAKHGLCRFDSSVVAV